MYKNPYVLREAGSCRGVKQFIPESFVILILFYNNLFFSFIDILSSVLRCVLLYVFSQINIC